MGKFWWSDRQDEPFWLEITERPDIGEDLKAPQTDKGGTRPHHAYILISEVRPGDLVFHYNRNVKAITGASRIAAAPFQADIVWGSLADGTTPFRRPGWKVPLEKYTPIAPVVSVNDFRPRQAELQQLALAESPNEAHHGPFQLERVPLRMAQAYLTKMPKSVVTLYPALQAAATKLLGDLPTPDSLPPTQLGQPYVPADENASTQPSDPFAHDPDVIDRGKRGHARTQNALARFLAERGIEGRRPAGDEPGFDLAWQEGDTVYVAEVKSITPRNQEKQLRLGLGQVLRYRQLMMRPGRKVIAVLVPEIEPDLTWIALAAELSVVLAWPPTFDDLAVKNREAGKIRR